MKKASPRILAVGLHPAIDRTIELPELRLDPVLRGRLVRVDAGGKTTNVVRTLSSLGCRITVTGFLGRNEADFFLRSFDAKLVESRFSLVDCPTRENLTIIEKKRGREIHILAGEMSVRRGDVQRLKEIVRKSAPKRDYIIFSGSAPKGISTGDYLGLLRSARAGGGRLVVDASGELLRAALKARPWLVKPNREELAELTGLRFRSMEDIVRAASALLSACENVLVSLGKEGAILVTPEGVWHAIEMRPPKPVMSVGCGDTMMAGFISAHAGGADAGKALQFAVACGSACVRITNANLRSADEPRSLLKKIRLKFL